MLRSKTFPLMTLNITFTVEKQGCDALPPCWNVLKQHKRRVNCQTKLWRLCLEAMISKAPP